ncbi:MAG: ammonia-forming cytochrome c nitrite reductase subunit c552, partial [Candidatus Electrothrix sp. AR3]|nr:ammonia-forming cytochrome c nitrite reductase subunit c552 [Candidatus Electrothrix sp. AR3]
MNAVSVLFRIFLVLVGSMLLFCQPIAAKEAAQKDPHAIVKQEAQTIDELVALFDESKCAQCHEEIYKEWKESWHAKAVVSSLKGIHNFIAIGLVEEWKKPLTKAQVLKCLDCHAPVVNYASEELAQEIGKMIVTAYKEKDKPAGKKAKAELEKLNIGCLSCHNMKAITVARGLRGDPKKDAIYGPNGADTGGAHKTVETVDITRSVFCMQCHGKYKSPDGETIQCNTLSGSYQNAYNNLGGSKSCQDCHMKRGKGHL